jgi:DNA-binding transcriptional LysR family regulator
MVFTQPRTLEDSNATARRLAGPSRMLVASPAYLRHAGVPKTPADLSTHSVIIGPAGLGGDSWTFERDGRTVSPTLEGRLNVSQNEGAVVAASIGLGIASTALWGCRAELLSGTLVQVLADWRMEPAEMHAVFPAGATKPSARAFADYIADVLRR